MPRGWQSRDVLAHADDEFAFREDTWAKTLAGEISVEEYRRQFPGAWCVRSEDGRDYRVGTWRDGVWIPGSRADAERELAGLGEPGASVVWKPAHPYLGQ